MFRGQFQALSVGACQQLWLPLVPPVPDRPHGMNDKFGVEVSSAGDYGFAGGQATLPGDDLFTFLQNGGASGPVNGSEW